MTDIRKATTEDIKLINELAWIAFPATYKDILTKEQIDYMMDWMYSPIWHTRTTGLPDMCQYRRKAKTCFICRKSMSCLNFKKSI